MFEVGGLYRFTYPVVNYDETRDRYGDGAAEAYTTFEPNDIVVCIGTMENVKSVMLTRFGTVMFVTASRWNDWVKRIG
jgi:hypothetical protein